MKASTVWLPPALPAWLLAQDTLGASVLAHSPQTVIVKEEMGARASGTEMLATPSTRATPPQGSTNRACPPVTSGPAASPSHLLPPRSGSHNGCWDPAHSLRCLSLCIGCQPPSGSSFLSPSLPSAWRGPERRPMAPQQLSPVSSVR